MFLEYGGADLPDVDRAPDGATQCVYWVDGDVIERVSRDGRWVYSLIPVDSPGASSDSDWAPSGARGGVELRVGAEGAPTGSQ